MDLQTIRDQLIHDLMFDLSNWSEVTNNTNPGNYGVEDWDVSIPEDGFYVDIPNRAFSFEEVGFSAKLILGASKGDSSFLADYNEIARGKGRFDFIGNDKVQITDIEVEIDLEIYK